jgi:hypothetical protein
LTMNILCDTCSVLMLIRIAPDMFTDERFDCVTVQEVCEEIFRTQRFKTKYPWRTDYKDKIRPSNSLRNTGDVFELHLDVVRRLVDAGRTSSRTGKAFGLSFVDKKIAAYVTAYDLEISSTDNSLIDFLEQEFDKKNKSPLAILNGWIRGGLITWNEEVRKIVEDWDKNGEPVQPTKDKKDFLRLTGVRYAGP